MAAVASSKVRPRAAPFAVLVDSSSYRAVASRWAALNFVIGGLGGALINLVLILGYRHLDGYHPAFLYLVYGGLVVGGLVVGAVFRRSLRVGMAIAGGLTAVLVGLSAAGAGRSLAPTVCQGTVVIATSIPVLYGRRSAVLILAASLAGSAAVFLTASDGAAPGYRILMLTSQVALYAALMLWFSSTLLRMAAVDQEARAESEKVRRELSGMRERQVHFLNRMSHELRTPLNAIIGFADMLRLGMVGPLSDRQKEYVTDISSSGEHLLALVTDALDVQRVEAGQVDLCLTPHSIERIVHDSAALCREEAVRRRIALTVACSKQLGPVICDDRKIKQILLNLISNSLKFTPAGGTILVRAASRGRAIEVSVVDSGPGVAPEDRQRIFSAFEQGSTAQKDAPMMGTGLGLAVARRLAEHHGGTLTLASSSQPGATFVLRLPATPDRPLQQPDSETASPSSKRPSSSTGVLDTGSAFERLLGADGLARFRAKLVAAGAIAEGLVAIVIHLLPRHQEFPVHGWGWTGVNGFVIGLVMLHPRVKLTATQMYAGALISVVYIGWYLGELGPVAATSLSSLLLVEGIAAFTFFRLRRAVLQGVATSIAYAVVLAMDPHDPLAPIRWLLTVSLLVSGAVMSRWLLGFLPALAESERQARQQIEHTNAELASANQHKSDVFASMSHELRTPLNAIIGFADALGQEVFGPLEPQQAEYLRDIETSGRELLDLINDILDLAKADAGRLQLMPRETSVTEIVEPAVATGRVRVEASADSRRDELILVGDPHRLVQAVSYVVDYAAAFSDVTVRASGENGVVTIEVRAPQWRLDDGDRQRLFATFESAGGHQAGPGRGVGLALSRRLIELHRGHLDVTSSEREGTVFSFELPQERMLDTLSSPA